VWVNKLAFKLSWTLLLASAWSHYARSCSVVRKFSPIFSEPITNRQISQLVLKAAQGFSIGKKV
jgi:hypothetical protein